MKRLLPQAASKRHQWRLLQQQGGTRTPPTPPKKTTSSKANHHAARGQAFESHTTNLIMPPLLQHNHKRNWNKELIFRYFIPLTTLQACQTFSLAVIVGMLGHLYGLVVYFSYHAALTALLGAVIFYYRRYKPALDLPALTASVLPRASCFVCGAFDGVGMLLFFAAGRGVAPVWVLLLLPAAIPLLLLTGAIFNEEKEWNSTGRTLGAVIITASLGYLFANASVEWTWNAWIMLLALLSLALGSIAQSLLLTPPRAALACAQRLFFNLSISNILAPVSMKVPVLHVRFYTALFQVVVGAMLGPSAFYMEDRKFSIASFFEHIAGGVMCLFLGIIPPALRLGETIVKVPSTRHHHNIPLSCTSVSVAFYVNIATTVIFVLVLHRIFDTAEALFVAVSPLHFLSVFTVSGSLARVDSAAVAAAAVAAASDAVDKVPETREEGADAEFLDAFPSVSPSLHRISPSKKAGRGSPSAAPSSPTQGGCGKTINSPNSARADRVRQAIDAAASSAVLSAVDEVPGLDAAIAGFGARDTLRSSSVMRLPPLPPSPLSFANDTSSLSSDSPLGARRPSWFTLSPGPQPCTIATTAGGGDMPAETEKSVIPIQNKIFVLQLSTACGVFVATVVASTTSFRWVVGDVGNTLLHVIIAISMLVGLLLYVLLSPISTLEMEGAEPQPAPEWSVLQTHMGEQQPLLL